MDNCLSDSSSPCCIVSAIEDTSTSWRKDAVSIDPFTLAWFLTFLPLSAKRSAAMVSV